MTDGGPSASTINHQPSTMSSRGARFRTGGGGLRRAQGMGGAREGLLRAERLLQRRLEISAQDGSLLRGELPASQLTHVREQRLRVDCESAAGRQRRARDRGERARGVEQKRMRQKAREAPY